MSDYFDPIFLSSRFEELVLTEDLSERIELAIKFRDAWWKMLMNQETFKSSEVPNLHYCNFTEEEERSFQRGFTSGLGEWING